MSTQNNTPATQQPKSVANYLNMPSTVKFLNDTLQDKKAEFVSNLIALCDSDPKLAECDPGSLIKCAMNATAVNLPLNKNLGMAYVIAYNGVPSFQIGYKGIIQLAIRTGSYKFINATEIREGEIKRNKITGELTYLGENPDGKVVGYIAYLELMSGFTASLYMSEEQIEAHAMRFSKSYQYDKRKNTMSSKWSDPDARLKMSLKTVLKGLLGTYGLMTTEFAKAFESDNDEAEEGEMKGHRASQGQKFDEAQVISQEEPKQTSQPTKINL